MSKDSSMVGKIGFSISLIPVAIIIAATQMRSQTIRDFYWPLIGATIIFALVALILSIASLRLSSRRKWAVAGATFGGLEIVYMVLGIMSHLGLSGQVIQ